MKKIILLIVISIFTTSVSAKTYVCSESEKVLLDGVLITRSYSLDDYTAGSYPALKLKSPIDVNCEPDDDTCEPEKNVSILQLWLDYAGNVQYEKLKGKEVKVYGTLFHRITLTHHHTPIIINVDSIK
jgi:hypothetical protein